MKERTSVDSFVSEGLANFLNIHRVPKSAPNPLHLKTFFSSNKSSRACPLPAIYVRTFLTDSLMSKPHENSLAASEAAAEGGVHAGVLVLTSRPLWDLITGFMDGYPYVVHQLYKQYGKLYNAFDAPKYHYLSRSLASQLGKKKGVLPHLAIAMNCNLEMLQLLYKLATRHHQYQRDPKLKFNKVMRYAVMFGRVDVLEYIRTLHASDPKLKWEPNLMRLALDRDFPELHVLEWLYAHVPPDKGRALFERDMLKFTEKGNLSVVQWLHEHKRKITKRTLDIAARHGQLHVLQYFYAHSERCCTDGGLQAAVIRGFVDVVEFVVANHKKDISREFISIAAQYGQLEVVAFFIERSSIPLEATYVIDYAIESGNAELVKYLHDNQPERCSTKSTLRGSAMSGDSQPSTPVNCLESAKCATAFACSPRTMSDAAVKGHLEMVEFLLHNCGKGSTAEAMYRAAERGHLRVVRLLHANLTKEDEDYSAATLKAAARNGHYEVMQFLCEHRGEETESSVIELALREAAVYGRMKIVKLLHSHFRPGESAYQAVEAASPTNHSAIIKFLCENQQQEPVGFLQQAVTNDSKSVINAVWRLSSVTELVEAREFALELHKHELARVLAEHVQSRLLLLQSLEGICREEV